MTDIVHHMSHMVYLHCKNVITLVWSSQLHLFKGFYYTRMITVYKPHIEILIATFCFLNWWSRTAKALQSWETPNRCNSDNHSNFKMTLTFLRCSSLFKNVKESHAIGEQSVINPRRACAARVTVGLCVCLSVCLFVDDYSRTTGYEATYERYQQLQCYKGMKNNVAILLKRLRSRDMA